MRTGKNAVSILALSLLLAACATRPPAADLAIVGASIVRPDSGRLDVEQTVLVRGDRIVAVGDAAGIAIPARTRVIDGRGRFLIPGLWDMHVHALWDPVVETGYLSLFVAHGITGVRDMGGTLEVLQAVREKQRTAAQPWPQLVAAGPILDGPQPVDPSISLAIADPAQARDAVASLADAGVDFIKVYTLLPPAAFRAVVASAKARGLAVVGHVPYGVDAREAARGMRSVEHLRAETGGLCAAFTDLECGEIHAALAANRVWQTPTLVARRPRASLDDPRLGEDPRLRELPAVLRAMWLGNRQRTLARLGPAELAARREDFRRERREAGLLPSRGLRVLAGSDAGSDFVYPGSGLHEELALLVEAGLTPAQALQAATSEPARYLQREDIGHVGAGAIADLVLLDADPLADIRNTAGVHAVVLRGKLYDRHQLEQMRIAAAEAGAR